MELYKRKTVSSHRRLIFRFFYCHLERSERSSSERHLTLKAALIPVFSRSLTAFRDDKQLSSVYMKKTTKK